MRLLVLTLACIGAALLYPAQASAREVDTSAAACVVIDAHSGRILLEHNAAQALPMASTTKVMTALLAIEQGDLASPVTCSRNAFGVPGTSIYLTQGETLTLEQMLMGLMLQSGNDAAVAIAEHIGGTVEDFCRMMTARAAELGCRNTVFLTPHGLPCQGHFTTAHDLALIAREAMRHSIFRSIVSTRRATIPWEGRSYDRVLNNKNRLLSAYEGATGIKTGYTRAAGRCLVFGARRDGMEIIGVVLNCYDWFDEAARLMDVAFAEFEAVPMACAGDSVRRLPVLHGACETMDAVLSEELSGVVPRNAIPAVEIHLPDAIEAPVEPGQVLGEIHLTWQGERISSVPLVADQGAARDDFASRWRTFLGAWLLLPGTSDLTVQ